MKKLLFNLKMILLVLATGLISMNAFGQLQVGNSGFENWDNVDSSSEEPTNWNSFKTANCTLGWMCGLAQQQQVERSNDAHSGLYSARIWSRNPIGSTIANGNLTIGRINMGSTTPTSPDNFNYTDINNSDFNQPLTDKPDSLVAWVKYNPIDPTDKARVSATIHDAYNYRDPENATASSHVVAKAELNYPSTNQEWVRLSIPFDYVGPSTDAQYILITFTTNEIGGGGSDNDEVFIDDLELIYNPNTVEIAPLLAQNIYSNENGTTLTATETPNVVSSVTSRQWKYATNPGGPYTNSIVGETGTSYTPNFASAGTYYVVCETDFNGDLVTSNEVQVNVADYSAAVSPSATQNLIETQVGNTLSVTEDPVADSREWKYSMTSGSGYVSFGTPEIGTTYAPQFTTAGTYYVVCESIINGTTVLSNEVQINVAEFTVSIAPSAAQNIFENQPGNTLTVAEAATVDSREWKYSETQGSGYASFVTAQTGATYTPQFVTASTYYVVCESTIDGITVTSNEVEINVTVALNNSVAISPNSIQTLIENQVGATITASEIPNAADTREWKWSTTSGSGYTSFVTAETGVTYTPQFANAGTYYIVCESDFAGDIQVSNEVQIDVIEFTVSIDPSAAQTLIETEVGNTLTVTETPSADSREWKYSETQGSGYVSFASAEIGMTYDPVFANAGTYYIVAESTINGVTVTSNEVEINVVEFTVSIDPSAAQTLIETEVGNTLTVTETPSADSREWKYSETQGSGYVSFTTAEIGTTYDPVFANAGTYYVVAESTINGVTVTSNEVEINVVEFTVTIAPDATQSLLENEVGDELEVTEGLTADSREWKYSETQGSGYVSFATAETGTTYTPQFATAGTYHVVCESTINGVTVTSNEVAIIVVEDGLSIGTDHITVNSVYVDGKDLLVDLSDAELKDATITVLNTTGAVIVKQSLNSNQKNTVQLSVPTGIYFYAISSGTHFQQGKVVIR